MLLLNKKIYMPVLLDIKKTVLYTNLKLQMCNFKLVNNSKSGYHEAIYYIVSYY